MAAASIVVLSRFADLFRQFKAAAERVAPGVRKILVRDGSEITPPEGDGWITIQGPEPFCFSRNANLGISAAGTDDVLLCNDDAELVVPDSIGILQKIAHADERIGLVAPQVEGRAKLALQRREFRLPQEPMFTADAVAFVCVYLKRQAMEAVGGLDEQFEFGAFEDDDYCRRLRLAGFELAVTGKVFVRHGYGAEQGSVSIYRRFGGYRDLIEKNRPRFERKWPQ